MAMGNVPETGLTDRRSLIRGAAGLGLAAALPSCAGMGTPQTGLEATSASSLPLSASAVYVPGYEPEKAGAGSFALDRIRLSLSHGEGPRRMISRIGMDGSVRQALLPAWAHDVEIAPDKSVGVLCGFEARDHVAFDPETLELAALAPAFAPGWRGGGHAVYIDGGRSVLISERAPRQSVPDGRLASQFGRITIRDAATLKIRGSHSSHGIDPHDIRLIDGGKHLVIANYGSLPREGERDLAVPRKVAQACVTIIETASGKLLDKIVTNRSDTELRHLAAGSRDRIFAIQALIGGPEFTHLDPVEDITSEPGIIYRPAATLKLVRGRKPQAMGNAAATREMRHGLSIVYDPKADQAIATYPSSHRVMVFDGASGAVLREFDTRPMGLEYPCGVTLMPDGAHYAIAGYWRNLFVFERGSHRLLRERCLYPVFYGHSHITAA
jgi:hypothetical protein